MHTNMCHQIKYFSITILNENIFSTIALINQIDLPHASNT